MTVRSKLAPGEVLTMDDVHECMTSLLMIPYKPWTGWPVRVAGT